jgi:hypothetical protein
VTDETDRIDPLDVEARLRVLESLGVDEHVAIYDGLHRELRDQLASGFDGAAVPEGGADRPGGTGGPDAADRADGTGAPEGGVRPDRTGLPPGAYAADGTGAPESVDAPDRSEPAGGAPRPAS